MQPALIVGDYIYDWRDLWFLPVGTTVEETQQVVDPPVYATKTEPNLWERTSGHRSMRCTDMIYTDANLRVRTLPGDGSPTSFERWVWQFRDRALAAAHHSGVSADAVARALSTLGAGEAACPFWVGQRIANLTDLNRLPEGSQVLVGKIQGEDAWTDYSVMQRDTGRGWTRVLGMRGDITMPVYVARVGREGFDVAEPASVTEDVEAAIATFKVHAWAVGAKVKQSERWCGTYETVMRSLGIDQTVTNLIQANGHRVGERVSAVEVAGLPVGSITRWVHTSNPTSWAWYIRDASMTNRAGTRLLFSSNPSVRAQYSSSAQEILHLAVPGPGSSGATLPMHIAVTIAEFEQVPAGAGFYYQDSGAGWVKHTDGRLSAGGNPLRAGSNAVRDFGGIDRLRLVSLPTAPLVQEPF